MHRNLQIEFKILNVCLDIGTLEYTPGANPMYDFKNYRYNTSVVVG
jgi:hypothetical protein